MTSHFAPFFDLPDDKFNTDNDESQKKKNSQLADDEGWKHVKTNCGKEDNREKIAHSANGLFNFVQLK